MEFPEPVFVAQLCHIIYLHSQIRIAFFSEFVMQFWKFEVSAKKNLSFDDEVINI